MFMRSVFHVKKQQNEQFVIFIYFLFFCFISNSCPKIGSKYELIFFGCYSFGKRLRLYSQILGIVLTLPLASLTPWTCLGSSDTVVCLGMSPRIPSVWNVFEVAHPVGTLAVEGFGTHFFVCCLLTCCLPGHVSKHFHVACELYVQLSESPGWAFPKKLEHFRRPLFIDVG